MQDPMRGGSLKLLARSSFGLMLLVVPARTWAQAPVRVGENVRVSAANPARTHAEVLVAAHPSDPRRLLACAMMLDAASGEQTTLAYLSGDGGRSWVPVAHEGGPGFSWDPTCTFDADGTAYFAALARDERGALNVVRRSRDGGRTWEPPASVDAPRHSLDRHYLVADTTSGRYHGRLYLVGNGWTAGTGGAPGAAPAVGLYRSSDSGVTWRGPVTRTSLGRRFILGMGAAAVLSDGTLAIAFPEVSRYWREDGSAPDSFPKPRPGEPNAMLKVVTSADGGESLSGPVTVGDFYLAWPPGRTTWFPTVAADPGSPAYRDRLYVVWPDVRSGRAEVLLAYSSDKGKAWSKPLVVNDDRADSARRVDHLNPAVAVNRDGVVAVTWYDRRESADGLSYSVRFRASLDGGMTWLPSISVSSAPSAYGGEEWPMQLSPWRGPTEISATMSFFHFTGGETAGLAADAAGVFHPVWVDNRTGVAQLWTAPVSVAGAVVASASDQASGSARGGVRDGAAGSAPRAASELPGYQDVSDQVRLELADPRYDRATSTLTLTARLKNISADELRGPFRVRVDSAASSLGSPRIANAAGGGSGTGAYWRFESDGPTPTLRPGAESPPKQLVIRLTDVRPPRPGATDYTVARLRTRVFARAAPQAHQ